MEKLEFGCSYKIHSYKHNGIIYKSWNQAIYLGYDKEEEAYIFVNEYANVLEMDGRTWHTKEPAILFFYKKHWYNVIAQCKNNGISYYCNLASPVFIEEKTIKYVDYDLDVKVFKDGAFKILDWKEYNYHNKKMQYPIELNYKIKEELEKLILKVRDKDGCFSKEMVEKYYQVYLKIKKQKKLEK